MHLEPYIDSVREHLRVAAAASGDEGGAAAGRLVEPLGVAIRLAIQDALTDAAEEITVELAPGSVELRLRGREPEFVVSLPPADPSDAEIPEATEPSASVWRRDGDEGTVARINLRLPDRLKSRVEQAAEAEGLSTNAWLVRAAASELERRDPLRERERRTPQGAQRYRGWAR